MIVVRVELWSAVSGEKSELARMWIDNVGGTQSLGDYRVRTLRGRKASDFVGTPKVQREGQVNRHPRLKQHVWNLVAKALGAMEYGR